MSKQGNARKPAPVRITARQRPQLTAALAAMRPLAPRPVRIRVGDGARYLSSVRDMRNDQQHYSVRCRVKAWRRRRMSRGVSR
jgi:hypothetical protein